MMEGILERNYKMIIEYLYIKFNEAKST